MGHFPPQGGKQGAGLGTFYSVSAPLCDSPSGITQVIFTLFLLTSALAHRLNKPDRIPQIPPCPVPIRFPSRLLPASLSLFCPQGVGEENSRTFGTREKAEGNRDKERQQRYFAGGSVARTLCFHRRRHMFDARFKN